MECITKDNHKIYWNCPGPHFCDGYNYVNGILLRIRDQHISSGRLQCPMIFHFYRILAVKKMLTFQFSITVNSKYIITITDNKKTKSPITANNE